ncbi:Rhodanese-related sulfurtransferase [Prosthecobacter debontii]|uniref:Rhodanese-related sulfurtransferase n=1 Tax=Prosthecobacter debontii TaxID=48467 RepID=A0A1T4XSW1_9BACT|nr:rhodanese-like domain-containing protein [Prosthecobacter debontii]SKA92483.1 Rhodanese-related sulfurtransferase [Prosthecobacter debontii]
MRFFWSLLICFTYAAIDAAPLPDNVELGPPKIQLPASVQQLSPLEVAAWLTAHPEATVIDLRMPEEITREGRLTGSHHYDFLQSSTADKLAQLDHDKPYLLYCALGGRSEKAAVQLSQQGFKQLVILKGGLDAWLKAGQPVSK